jgi:hypothetical protein
MGLLVHCKNPFAVPKTGCDLERKSRGLRRRRRKRGRRMGFESLVVPDPLKLAPSSTCLHQIHVPGGTRLSAFDSNPRN